MVQLPDDIALWATQGGGVVKWDMTRQAYVWVKLPDWYATHPEIKEKVGDPIPAQWGVVPLNEAAVDELAEWPEEAE